MKLPKEIIGLWFALTIPVVVVGAYVSYQVSQVRPGVVTQYVNVTPTASPSAALIPSVPVASPTAVFKSTVKGGVK